MSKWLSANTQRPTVVKSIDKTRRVDTLHSDPRTRGVGGRMNSKLHAIMKTKNCRNRWSNHLLILILLFPVLLRADNLFVGGPRKPGQARPPLWINAGTGLSAPYDPVQIRHAYGVDQLSGNGAGQKIALIEAYGNGSIQTDLNTFCAQFGFPNTTVQVLGSNNTIDSGWALESALDVEWAHAIAPGATIIFSVAPSPSITDLLNAVTAAVNAGANVISMSWGSTEFSGESGYDPYFQAPGVTFVASSGDSGELSTTPEVEWPAVSPYVVGVGGTSLSLDSNTNRSSETAWASGGGGLSSYYSRPSWQNTWSTFSVRGVPDVSYNADPNTGVYVYDAANGGWYEVGGTSAGAPQWAALLVLANQSRSAGVNGSSDIYTVAGTAPTINAANFYDVKAGSNGSDPDDQALTGYDLVTGLGSPAASGLIPALIALSPKTADFTISLAPSTENAAPAAGASYTITVTPSLGFSENINLSATLPNGAGAGSFSVNPILGSSGNSVLTFTAPTGTGTFTVTVTGTSATSGKVHSASATLIVASPDFTLSASPTSRSVRHGSGTSYTISVSPSGGFTGAVALSGSVSPAVANGPTISYTPTQVNGGSGSSTLTVRTTSSTPRTNYTITTTGSNGSLHHTVVVTLTVR